MRDPNELTELNEQELKLVDGGRRRTIALDYTQAPHDGSSTENSASGYVDGYVVSPGVS